VSATAEDRGIALLASLSDALEILRRLLATGDPRRAGADVHPLEQADQLIDVRPQRVVTTGVGRKAISASTSLVAETPVGSGQPASSAASTRPCRAVCVHPDELHVVAPDDGVQRRLPMLPVVHWITRSDRSAVLVVMCASSLRPDQ
jgi:hypothetical protein